jgi:outer membrane receptor protein involved in Fe transport
VITPKRTLQLLCFSYDDECVWAKTVSSESIVGPRAAHARHDGKSICSVLMTDMSAYTVINESVALKADDWTVWVWIRNLADEEYIIGSVDVRAQQFCQNYYADPRTIGVELTYNW